MGSTPFSDIRRLQFSRREFRTAYHEAFLQGCHICYSLNFMFEASPLAGKLNVTLLTYDVIAGNENERRTRRHTLGSFSRASLNSKC